MLKWNSKVKKGLFITSGVISTAFVYDNIWKHGNETLRIGATGQLTLLTTESTLLYALDSINMRSKVVKGENKSMAIIVKEVVWKEGYKGLFRGI